MRRIVNVVTGEAVEDAAFVPSPVTAPPPPTRWQVPRSTLVDRMTVAEVTVMRALLATLDAKTQERWLAVSWVWSDDPDVLAAAKALGWTPARVAELLAPEAAG